VEALELAELVRLVDALADDELAGVLWLADVGDGVVLVALSDPELQPASTAANPTASAPPTSRLRMSDPLCWPSGPSAREPVGPCTDSRKIIPLPAGDCWLGRLLP
jgi:hypothetical protein